MSRDALVVGINRYSFLNALKAPALDAEAIAQRLQQDGEFSKVVRLPENIDPTNSNKPSVSATQTVYKLQLEQELKKLFRPNSSQAPETALFYFSGHGILDEEGFDQGYLATSDTNPTIPRTGISFRWLQWLLSESEVKQQIVWLDCCHSGSLMISMDAANPGNSNSRDRCFVASSRNFESSWEDLNSPYSILTKALLEGLDPTRLPGRWIDTFALVDYVNQALKGDLQTPVCTNFGEAINLTKTWRVTNSEADEFIIDSNICPYKGLEFFDCNEEDPKYFFGREKLTGQLLDHVRTQAFLALVGASGNGKSSVLRAGLLHQLKLGRRIAGSDEWQILVTRPDAEPIKNLAITFVSEGGTQLDRAESIKRAEAMLMEGSAGLQRLVQASTAPRTIVVIDQFEEIFTRCDSAKERAHFFSCLMGAIEASGDKLCVIIAMRSDFVGKCLSQNYSGLAQMLPANTISVLPLTEKELRDSICKPAEQVGLVVEPILMTDILSDIKGAPGSLPLLQYTLKELWQRRQDSQLTLTDYQNLGGINGTLNQRANEIYNNFDKLQKRTVQHIFQQLTQLGEGTEDTRRRVFVDNLIAEPLHSSEQVRTVIDTLSNKDNRLLVTSEVLGKGDSSERRAIVDVAHEALIRHWQLLRQWIEQNRDLLRQQRRIELSTVAWQERDQSQGYLLQGLLLIEATQFQKKYSDNLPLSEPAQTFVRKSVWKRRWSRIRTASWLIIPATLIVGLAEYNIRETRIKSDFARFDSDSLYEEKQAVQDLVSGCYQHKRYAVVPRYISERIFGSCRPLIRSRLSEADLSYAELTAANLRSAKLDSANLAAAELSFADLSKAQLYQADLSLSNLVYANLSEAKLDGADLHDADLTYANLGGARLRNAEFWGATLIDAHFDDARLKEVGFTKADLRYASFVNSYLDDANFLYADLSNAKFRNASLRYASLRSIYMSDAVINESDLSGASLVFAQVINVDFSDSNLSETYISNTDLIEGTNLQGVILNGTIILSTDLRMTKGLTQAQLSGSNRPLICNSLLPKELETSIGKDRDCSKLADVLYRRYSNSFKTLDKAKEFVEEQKRKEWE